MYLYFNGQSLRLVFFSHRINELLLDILDSSTKEHEEKSVLENDETESLTDVVMEQMEGLLTGKGQLHSEEHLSVYNVSVKLMIDFAFKMTDVM